MSVPDIFASNNPDEWEDDREPEEDGDEDEEEGEDAEDDDEDDGEDDVEDEEGDEDEEDEDEDEEGDEDGDVEEDGEEVDDGMEDADEDAGEGDGEEDRDGAVDEGDKGEDDDGEEEEDEDEDEEIAGEGGEKGTVKKEVVEGDGAFGKIAPGQKRPADPDEVGAPPEKKMKVEFKEPMPTFDNYYKGIKRDFRTIVAKKNYLSGKPTTFNFKGRVFTIPLPIEFPEQHKKTRRRSEADKIRKLWESIAKRDIPKRARDVALRRTSNITVAKRVAYQVQKEVRKKVSKKFRDFRDNKPKVKKLVKEMLQYWRKHERAERDSRKLAQKEALERQRIEEEKREAKRQARKLNFLLTQTELYSHFVGSKQAKEGGAGAAAVPATMADAAHRGGVDNDEELAELQQEALESASAALRVNSDKMRAFDAESRELRNEAVKQQRTKGPAVTGGVLQNQLDKVDLSNPEAPAGAPGVAHQPKMIQGDLKAYQLKGLNWLINLYEQGINGILADEMGLGKTVQAISLLAYLAEFKGIWGPFLVVAPASTLHNWQQEIKKFTPALKVLPYWGSQKDRKVLRKFCNRKDLYHEHAAFHVMVTSYQLLVRDEQYLKRIKWQYMVLDEAQALKSSRSNRWKTLLGFSCRNRLLLTGTPIQNSMAELWALLHFIMPTLFDSHAEFNEWFSKDIEATAKDQNGSSLTDHQLSRLHLVLKPFMLRRVKTQVEHELAKKVEVEVKCEMSTRQLHLYRAIKARVSVAELLMASSSADGNEHLMNLVMQFRKVCNHPEIFERRDAHSPLFFCQPHPFENEYAKDPRAIPVVESVLQAPPLPLLLYNEGTSFLHPQCTGDVHGASLRSRWLSNMLSIFSPTYVHSSLKPNAAGRPASPCFSFTRLSSLSPAEVAWIHGADPVERWLAVTASRRRLVAVRHMASRTWGFAEDVAYAPSGELRAHPGASTALLVRTCSSLCPGLPFDGVLGDLVEGDPVRRLEGMWPMVRAVRRGTCVGVPCRAPLPARQLPHVRAISAQERLVSGAWAKAALVGVDTSRWSPFASAPARPVIPSSLAIDCKAAADGRSFLPDVPGLMEPLFDYFGSSLVSVPDFSRLLADAGKLRTLDTLLARLKREGHRVLVYSQMTKMLDILEDYMYFRRHSYVRLDGSSHISDRRDMVEDFQTRDDIFCFLLSTRAGGLGINLTAADTVIFYDSDWNPTMDAQAMDRAHRLGQTKQVTVYRLVTRGTVEERILLRAKQKKAIQQLVIAGGDATNSVATMDLGKNEAISLLLDDDELSLAKQLEEAKAKRKAEGKKKAGQKSQKAQPVAPTSRTQEAVVSAPPTSEKVEPAFDDLFLGNGDSSGMTFEEGGSGLFSMGGHDDDGDVGGGSRRRREDDNEGGMPPKKKARFDEPALLPATTL